MAISKLTSGVDEFDPAASSGLDVANTVNSLVEAHVLALKALPTTPQTDVVYNVISFYAGAQTGGGKFVWQPLVSKALHNGVTHYAPEALAAWDGTQGGLAALLNWTGVGTGLWVRVSAAVITFEMAGAVLDANPSTGLGTDNTLAVNKTLATGLPVLFSKGFCKVTDKISMLAGQIITGAGRTASMFVIGTDFNMAAECVLKLGAQLEDIGLAFVQADQGVRANCTQYPWAIDFSDVQGCVINNVRVEGAWNGVKAAGNTGGASIRLIEIGALNVGFDIDGALDFFHADALRFWPFGFAAKTALLNGVYYDNATTSLKLGSCNGADFGTISMTRTKMEITANATSGTPSSFGKIQLYGDGARLVVYGGVNTISQVHSVKSAASATKSVEVLGGVTTVSDLQLLGVNPETDILVSTGSLAINGGSSIWSDAANPRMEVTTGTLQVEGFRVKNTPSAVYSVPFIKQSSNGRLVFKNNAFDEKTTGSGVAISYLTDNAGNFCLNNRLSGYSVTNPTNAALGTYQGTCSYTPILSGATTAGVGTYSLQDGKYTFVDDKTVLFSASLTWSAHTGAGGTRISLPHNLDNLGTRVPLNVYYSDLAVGASKEVGAFVGTSGNVLAVRALDPAGGVPLEFFDAAGTINISGFYRRA